METLRFPGLLMSNHDVLISYEVGELLGAGELAIKIEPLKEGELRLVMDERYRWIIEEDEVGRTLVIGRKRIEEGSPSAD